MGHISSSFMLMMLIFGGKYKYQKEKTESLLCPIPRTEYN